MNKYTLKERLKIERQIYSHQLTVNEVAVKYDINHYTEKVVLGLQARVALTQQRYAEAAEYARQAIEIATEEGLSIMTPEELTNGFADISSETNEAMYAALTQDDQTVYFYSFYAYMSWNFNSSRICQG